MRPAHIRNTCILVCAVLSVAACSTTRRLGSDEVLYTGVKKIRIEPDSGVVLSAAAESAVKEPLSVAPNNPLYSPYIRTPLPGRAVGLQLSLHAQGKGIQILVIQTAGQTARADLEGAAPTPHEGRGTGARKLRLFRLARRRLPALPQTRAEGKGVLYARHSAALALFEDNLSGRGQRHGTAHGQPPGHVPAPRGGAVQHGQPHARTQTDLPAAAQQGILLFPSRIPGIPGRYDLRSAGRSTCA